MRQFRLSIDIKSIQGISFPSHQVYCQYVYSAFGSNSPIMTLPPADAYTKNSVIDLNGSFNSYEFVMDPQHTMGYLQNFPLLIEVWLRDRYESDLKLGEAILPLNFEDSIEGKLDIYRKDDTQIFVMDRLLPIEWSETARMTFQNPTDVLIRIVVALEDFNSVEEDALTLAKEYRHSSPQNSSKSSIASSIVSQSDTEFDSNDADDSDGDDDEEAFWVKNEKIQHLEHLQRQETAKLDRIRTEWKLREIQFKEKHDLNLAAFDKDLASIKKFTVGLVSREKKLHALEQSADMKRKEIEKTADMRIKEVKLISSRFMEELKHQMDARKEESRRILAEIQQIAKNINETSQSTAEIIKQLQQDTGKKTAGNDELTNEWMRLNDEVTELKLKVQSINVKKSKMKQQWSETVRKTDEMRKSMQDMAEKKTRSERIKLEEMRFATFLREQRRALAQDRGVLSEIKKALSGLG